MAMGWVWFAAGAVFGWSSWAVVVRWLYGRIKPRVAAVVEPEGVGPVGPVLQDREPPTAPVSGLHGSREADGRCRQ